MYKLALNISGFFDGVIYSSVDESNNKEKRRP